MWTSALLVGAHDTLLHWEQFVFLDFSTHWLPLFPKGCSLHLSHGHNCEKAGGFQVWVTASCHDSTGEFLCVLTLLHCLCCAPLNLQRERGRNVPAQWNILSCCCLVGLCGSRAGSVSTVVCLFSLLQWIQRICTLWSPWSFPQRRRYRLTLWGGSWWGRCVCAGRWCPSQLLSLLVPRLGLHALLAFQNLTASLFSLVVSEKALQVQKWKTRDY